ncbi:MAG TPA: hypothetical protein VIY52_01240 [Streptosporangiaceae bacterium]
MARRAPSTVRAVDTICYSHDRAVHRASGLGPAVSSAIAVIEHQLSHPGQVAREFRRWQVLADHGLYRAPDDCGVPECCGPEPRELLEVVIGQLPGRARPAFRRAVQSIDAKYLSAPALSSPDPAIADASHEHDVREA